MVNSKHFGKDIKTTFIIKLNAEYIQKMLVTIGFRIHKSSSFLPKNLNVKYIISPVGENLGLLSYEKNTD
jgi:hypothetical protein